MDKPTRWLRVEVSEDCYKKIVSDAIADDREVNVYLRRHLEAHFNRPAVNYGFAEPCGCEIYQTCAKCRPKGLTGESVHGTPCCPSDMCGEKSCGRCYPTKPTVCLHDGVEPGTVMGVVCPCVKCSTTC